MELILMRKRLKLNRKRRKKRINSKRIKKGIRNKNDLPQKTKQRKLNRRMRRKRKYRSKTRIKRNYRTHAKKPILGYRFWDETFKFERRWGVMRRGKGWPRH